ncbi:hypothetical protein, partial [Serratia marcescens]|uniref:hypothetical protein n=1 Tax=Serratia marcescens TaxID=615 RepID=UPI002FDA1A35
SVVSLFFLITRGEPLSGVSAFAQAPLAVIAPAFRAERRRLNPCFYSGLSRAVVFYRYFVRFKRGFTVFLKPFNRNGS